MKLFYYSILIVATFLFGVQFYFNGKYTEGYGASVWSTVVLAVLTGLGGGTVMFAINGFTLHVTPYTLILAAIMAVDSLLCTFFGIKALDKANLSMYSLFSMIGGMLLPFIAGILLFSEPMTGAKAICLVFIIAAICVTIERGAKAKGKIWCIGIFIFNGLAGVISQFFNNATYPKASNADYTILHTLIKVVIASVILLILFLTRRKQQAQPAEHRKMTFLILLFAVLSGILNTVANYMLLIALQYVPGSMQYPIVTGGVIIFSTLFAYLTPKKPRFKDWISVVLAFVGMLALLLPI